MQQETLRTIQNLLSGSDPDDLLRGLAIVEAGAPGAEPETVERLVEMVMALFYIDTLDHPEHLPAVERAIAVTAGLGKATIPTLIQNMEAGDVKAQLAIAQALGRMGTPAIDPLIAEYQSGCPDPACRAFLLFALGKVKSPEILKAASLAADAADSPDLELRDTATRAIGKFVESIPPGGLPDDIHASFVARLESRLGDTSPGVRAKAVRSLGKLAKYGHLTPEERGVLRSRLQRILGEDPGYEWDRAYIVRKEAREALAFA